MRQIVVISGKGGAGKTFLTASFAALADDKVMADCDVDVADLHFLLHPSIRETHKFISGKTAFIDREKCQQCGECIDNCRFEAISPDFEVDPIECEGCGVCSHVCPSGAVFMEDNESGEWYISDTRYGPFVHAKLGIAEENSGKLVSQVKQAARRIAEERNVDYMIVDGPPGIGCPVIASLADADLAVIVAEPTLSGIHDLQRVMDVTVLLKTKMAVVINKYDVNKTQSKIIEEISRDRNVEVIGRIPFSKGIYESVVNLQPVVEYCSDRITEEIASIWDRIHNANLMGVRGQFS